MSELRQETITRGVHGPTRWVRQCVDAALLENGLKATRIGLTAQESQYIETRPVSACPDIARIFRIPDVLLGISQGKSSTYASAEQFFLAYVKYTLGPWCKRIEQAIQRDLLAPSET